MNLLIPGDIRRGQVPPRVLHNAVLLRSDPREFIVYKVVTRQDVSQLDSDFVLQNPSLPPISSHINPYLDSGGVLRVKRSTRCCVWHAFTRLSLLYFVTDCNNYILCCTFSFCNVISL